MNVSKVRPPSLTQLPGPSAALKDGPSQLSRMVTCRLLAPAQATAATTSAQTRPADVNAASSFPLIGFPLVGLPAGLPGRRYASLFRRMRSCLRVAGERRRDAVDLLLGEG